MGIRLNQKRFEAPLIQMPAARRVPMRMPALGVRQRQPGHEPRQVAISERPQNEMPVIGHEAIREQPHRDALLRLG